MVSAGLRYNRLADFFIYCVIELKKGNIGNFEVRHNYNLYKTVLCSVADPKVLAFRICHDLYGFFHHKAKRRKTLIFTFLYLF